MKNGPSSLRYIVTAARDGNSRAVTNEVNVRHPIASKRIKVIEHELGVRFSRAGTFGRVVIGPCKPLSNSKPVMICFDVDNVFDQSDWKAVLSFDFLYRCDPHTFFRSTTFEF